MDTSKEEKDRRIRRSRRALRDALIALILEKDFSSITIQEIADRADVNRATFYLHFHDKQELLLRTLDEIYVDLTARMKPPTGRNFRMDVPPESALNLFRHIAENAVFYRVALGKTGIPSFQSRVRELLAEVSSQRLLFIQPDRSKYRISVQITAAYNAGAILGMTVWWLENGMPIPPEMMATYTLQLAAMGTYWALQTAPPPLATPQSE